MNDETNMCEKILASNCLSSATNHNFCSFNQSFFCWWSNSWTMLNPIFLVVNTWKKTHATNVCLPIKSLFWRGRAWSWICISYVILNDGHRLKPCIIQYHLCEYCRLVHELDHRLNLNKLKIQPWFRIISTIHRFIFFVIYSRRSYNP